MISASSDQPIMVRRDTKENFQWRVRNIPYPLEVYQIMVDENANQIIVRTSNKKWFKRISIPDMDRMHLKLIQSNVIIWIPRLFFSARDSVIPQVSFTHANRTLVISYAKPASILEVCVWLDLLNMFVRITHPGGSSSSAGKSCHEVWLKWGRYWLQAAIDRKTNAIA